MPEPANPSPVESAADESETGASQGQTQPTAPGSGQIAPTPSAVVVDTNIWGEGDLDLKALRDLAERLGRSDIEVWVPRQVVLEWARHAVDRAQAIAGPWKALFRAGQLETPNLLSTDVLQTVETMLARVADINNVKVLEMRGDSAVAGITDQILTTGPGATKQGVRTGAADSSWIRDAVAQAGHDLTRIIFLTKNTKDVVKTIRAMGMDITLLSVRPHVRALYEALFATSVATPAVQAKVAALLLSMSHWEDVDPHGPPSEGWLPLTGLDVRAFDTDDVPEGVEVDSYYIEGNPALVGVGDVRLVDAAETDPDKAYTALVEFNVRMLGTLVANGYTFDNDGSIVTSSMTLGECLVTAPCTADVADLEISNVSVSDEAIVQSARLRASETYDAWEDIVSYLATLSGFEFDDAKLADGEDVDVVGAQERTVTLVPRGGPYDEDWDLTLELYQADERVGSYELVCRYDPDASVWAGSESFDWRPPFYVSTQDGNPDAEPFSAIGAAWRWLLGE